jgi:hypothetical protein
MASRNSVYIKKETLDFIRKFGDAKGVEITVEIKDEPNKYGQNVTAYVSQSKEDKERKMPRQWVGNGNTFWTDGKITEIRRQPKQNNQSGESDDLPW